MVATGMMTSRNRGNEAKQRFCLTNRHVFLDGFLYLNTGFA